MPELICITCPRGCSLSIEMDNDKIKAITGNSCPRGIQYAENEIYHPMRMLTSTIKLNGGSIERCPVMTSGPVPKEMLFDVMKEIEKIEVNAPIHCKDTVIKNVCGLNIDIVATRTLDRTVG